MSEIIKDPGGSILTVDALSWEDNSKIIKLGMHWGQFSARIDRGQRFMLGQFHGILDPGIIFANRIYRGLNRDMLVKTDANADTRKIVYCWPAKNDFYLSGSQWNSTLETFQAPENNVFAVVVSPNDQLTDFPSIAGWLEHWSWIDACPDDPNAPLGNGTRYAETLLKT